MNYNCQTNNDGRSICNVQTCDGTSDNMNLPGETYLIKEWNKRYVPRRPPPPSLHEARGLERSKAEAVRLKSRTALEASRERLVPGETMTDSKSVTNSTTVDLLTGAQQRIADLEKQLADAVLEIQRHKAVNQELRQLLLAWMPSSSNSAATFTVGLSAPLPSPPSESSTAAAAAVAAAANAKAEARAEVTVNNHNHSARWSPNYDMTASVLAASAFSPKCA